MASLPSDGGTLRPIFSRTSRSSYVAEAAIARDLEDDPEDLEDGNDQSSSSDGETDSIRSTSRVSRSRERLSGSMVGSYRRPSYAIAGSRATAATGNQSSSRNPTKYERREARREERSLLRDNNVIPPKHPRSSQGAQTLGRRISKVFNTAGIPGGDRKVVSQDDESAITNNVAASMSDTTPLLGNPELPYGGQDSPEIIDKQWTEAVAAGKIQTTWQREAKVLARYSAPLVLTMLLQYSLTVASIFTVGHVGTVELGAVSLASMTANITGYAVYQGLATSLDTLCAQAYGSGKKKLVGLQTQRMV